MGQTMLSCVLLCTTSTGKKNADANKTLSAVVACFKKKTEFMEFMEFNKCPKTSIINDL